MGALRTSLGADNKWIDPQREVQGPFDLGLGRAWGGCKMRKETLLGMTARCITGIGSSTGDVKNAKTRTKIWKLLPD